MSPEDFIAAHGTTERFPPAGMDDRWHEQEGAPLSRREPKKAAPAAPIVPKLVYPTSLRGKPIPVMEWAVDQWVPLREVTLLYGDGGVGKTLLAQQLMACMATGKPWCSLPVRPCKSLGVFCEDDTDELHRRQDAIQRHLMTDFADSRMDAMAWWTRKGDDNLLATFDYEGKIQEAPLYRAIIEAAMSHGAQLIVLDTAADLYAGNENDRGQVRQFIGLLTRMAMECNAAVVLCAHPSRAGMSSGTMDSGSTGWSNSVRSRLALERPKAEEGADQDMNERVLTKKKANRSSIGDAVKLRWQDGVIAPVWQVQSASFVVKNAETTFLALMARCAEQGIYVSHSSKAGNFAPKVFSKRPEREGFTLREFDTAMNRLFAAKAIRVGSYKTPSRHIRDCLEVVPRGPAEEDEA